jgi:hypothetical protein
MKLRDIPYAMPKEVYEGAEERYYDTSTSYYIAIKKLNYAGKIRTMAVTYNKHGNKIEIITIHPIKEGQNSISESKRIHKNIENTQTETPLPFREENCYEVDILPLNPACCFNGLTT